jgi:N-acyl-D-amino-acid deacylase
MSDPRRFVLALALIAGACATRTDVRPHLDRFVTDLHARGLFSGAVVVGDERGVVWEGGFGFANIEHQVQFTPSTPADSGSLAKTFTAALVIALDHEGVLRLDEPLQRLLPELPYETITLRQLLSHSSGIPVLDYDFFDRDLPPPAVRTTEALLGVIASRKPPLRFEPGTQFEYSSFGYDLAALAAARATGRSYGELLAERYFRPLGFESTFLRPARLHEFPGVRTLGYRMAGGRTSVHDVFDFEAFHGGSNIYISARDLHRWNAMFFDDTDRGAVLDLATIGGRPSGLTLGSWYRSKDGSQFSYAGHLQGFHDEVFRDLRSMHSIVYVSNNTMEMWAQHALVRGLRRILAGEHQPPVQKPPIEPVARDQHASLKGRWLIEDGETVVIDDAAGYLRIEKNGVRYRMVQVDATTFYVPGLDLVLGFAREGDGSFARIYSSTNFTEGWGGRG